MEKYKSEAEISLDRQFNLILDNSALGLNPPLSTTYSTSGKPTVLYEENARALIELTALTDMYSEICKLSQQKRIEIKATKKNLFSGVKKCINLLLLEMTSLFIKALKKQALKRASTKTISHPPSMGNGHRQEDTGGISMGNKIVKITTPPIHTHYNSDTGLSELCGRVFCPEGFVGIEVIGNIYENPELLS